MAEAVVVEIRITMVEEVDKEGVPWRGNLHNQVLVQVECHNNNKSP